MSSKTIDESRKYLMNTYDRSPIILRKGRGMKVWSADGKEYLDFVGGVAVNCLGHCYPKVVIALQKQAQRLLHVSNLYHIEPQIKLAKLLATNSFADKAFFCNSGTEAVEAAIKLARKYSKDHTLPDKYEIITAENSFHGRTLTSLSATGQEKLQKGFEPLTPGFKHVPFNNIGALKNAITKHTCAVMLEPIQGEGGVRVPDKDYLKHVREICNDHGLLLILDEVQTGMGRTGKLFAYEHFNMEPDIICLAKGLGGGVAIGAILAKDHVAASFGHGSHGSTFGGNPLACTAAVAVIEAILEDGFILDNCRRMSEYFMKSLVQLKKEFPSTVLDARGMGLLLGLEITRSGSEIVRACAERGILINCVRGNVLRFIPPLIVVEKEIDQLMDVLAEVLERI
ncbi:MAG: aspartate aminotransferase family protein [Thermodesulfovibrionia bacterium]|nr:aspartate aminotransferase family protein [Thermodesulfovibrionia bacterium]